MEKINKKAILAVSFGTSYKDAEEKSINKIEDTLIKTFPDFEVRRAFTSEMIIKKLKKRDGIAIDNADAALKRLEEDGFNEVYIVPTYVIGGVEYDILKKAAESYAPKFKLLKLGTPVLFDDASYLNIASLVKNELKEDLKSDEAVIFMGHGTDHQADTSYEKLQRAFDETGDSCIVATVEGSITLDDAIEKLKALKLKKVVLHPFMIVAGDHAKNDMAGDEVSSWKNTLKAEGFSVRCIVKGLGEYEKVQELISQKAQMLIKA